MYKVHAQLNWNLIRIYRQWHRYFSESHELIVHEHATNHALHDEEFIFILLSTGRILERFLSIPASNTLDTHDVANTYFSSIRIMTIGMIPLKRPFFNILT